MHNITLISTRHHAIGECNSGLLQQILEEISPEVTFEETPVSSEKLSQNLEGFAISRYSMFRKVKRVSVDTDYMPSEAFFKDHKNALEQIEWLEDENGYNYRYFTDKNRENAERYGFGYLNSEDCIAINDKIVDAIEKGLQKLNNEKYTQAYQSWKDFNDRRECEMLQSIYTYSKENSYERATFTIGSGHRKSIMKKIDEYAAKESLRLNWSLLSFQ